MKHCTSKKPKLYCGIDLHTKKSYIYIINEQGTKVKSKEIDTEEQTFITFFESLIEENEIYSAIEISSLTFQYCNILKAIGISVYVVNTLKNAYISKSMKKTDKEDAKRLAISLWKEILPEPVYIPSEKEHSLRKLISHRADLVKSRTRLINRIRQRLREKEIKIPLRTLNKAKKIEPVLKSISYEIQPILHFEISHMFEQFKLLEKQIEQTEQLIHSQINKDVDFKEMYNLLLTVPGMGKITSAAFISRVGKNIKRFKNVRKLISYFGQCPKIRESGGKTIGNQGITKQGNGMLRGYLSQVAIAVLRSKSCNSIPLKKWYENIKRRKGWKKARVALSRKIAAICYGVLIHKRPYNPMLVTGENKCEKPLITT
ncbi:transposase IS116/IS110/IS902 family [Thermotomaculum hydrothermale]|uniref:Transposase IS116/IS110/IS902 family n=1 Tax=Thermotomaculum hydrothermale TaxID=981385 RepID=A0A7R6PSY2_9BACT|nr:IS110 family transposase [Thermotomaculum hydrothermale]BBB32037.1 transposase IS116/IS110/IS902 family [Thermotomaculum hydrothermale]